MAFPTVAARNNSGSVGVTNHIVSLPTGIVAGHKLMVFFGTSSDTAATWPAGWTEVSSLVTVGLTIELRERVADGLEGATITVTTGLSSDAGHRSWRITGYHATLSEAATAQGATANPNSPSLTPSWGIADTLWMSLFSANVTSETVSVFPTDYGNTFSDGTGKLVATCERQLNAASEDPSAFTKSGTAAHRSMTVAVRPGTEGGGGAAVVTRRSLLGVGV